MPVYSFSTYSNTDLGRPSGSIATGTFTVSGPPSVMEVQDDDGIFDDESPHGGQTLDTSQQVLSTNFDGIYSAGQVVRSVYRYEVTNNTTGETGYAYLIRIHTGTDPSSPGWQDGDYYNAFSIDVSAGDSITLSSGNYVGQTPFSNLVVCFTKGTGILTDKGERAVESLQAGDMVATRDNGYQQLRWIGKKTIVANSDVAPILFKQGVLGNHKDLLVSPNHRMMIESASADLLFAEHEVLVPAKHLLGNSGITKLVGGFVTYVHMLFDKHEIVFANGSPSESFYPGTEALDALEKPSKDEILGLFPELAGTGQSTAYADTARICLKEYEAKVLMNFDGLPC